MTRFVTLQARVDGIARVRPGTRLAWGLRGWVGGVVRALVLPLLLLVIGPFLVDDPVVREKLIGFLAAVLVLTALLTASSWASGAARMERDTARARCLAAFARGLPEAGRIARLGRATVVSCNHRGRPFTLVHDPRVGIAWELVAPGHAVELRVWRSRWLGPLARVRMARGGPESAWFRPGPGRGLTLAAGYLWAHGLTRIELANGLLRAEGPALTAAAVEPERLEAALRALGELADLLAPRMPTSRMQRVDRPEGA